MPQLISNVIFGICALLISIFALAAIIGDETLRLSSYLVLTFPILWAAWITLSFILKSKSRRLLKLGALWLAIDIAALMFYEAFGLHVHGWANSSGIELIILIVYFPIIFPLGYLIIAGLLLSGVNVGDLQIYMASQMSQFAGAFSMWILSSLLILPQSFLFVWLGSYLSSRQKIKP